MFNGMKKDRIWTADGEWKKTQFKFELKKNNVRRTFNYTEKHCIMITFFIYSSKYKTGLI